MNGSQTTLYFSKRHDADLISLYYQIGRKAFVKVMKESLRVLVRADYEPIFTKSLEICPTLLEGSDDETEDKPFFIVVSFSSEKDVDILHLLMNTKHRKTGAFVKNAMRLLLGPYYVLGCMLRGDENLNDAYKDRRLFFVSGGVVAAPVAVAKPAKTKKKVQKVTSVSDTKLSEPKALNDVDNTPDLMPVSKVPETSGEVDIFDDDDDVLSILEGM